MNKSGSGFTIVELLIVIVVIGTLAAITVVAYNGIQQKARSAQLLSAVDTYEKALRQYKVLNGQYPSFNDVNSSAAWKYACFGGTFPATTLLDTGECMDIPNNYGAVSPQVDTALRTVLTTLPTANNDVISNNTELRGITYFVNTPTEVSLLYYIAGDQTCGRGQKISFGAFTRCAVTLD